MEVVASLSQSRTAAAQCGLFTYKSVPVIFEPPCTQPEYSPSYEQKPAIKSHFNQTDVFVYDDIKLYFSIVQWHKSNLNCLL